MYKYKLTIKHENGTTVELDILADTFCQALKQAPVKNAHSVYIVRM